MILDYLSGKATLIDVLLCIPIVLIALSFHECAHGYVAYKMGDPTARNFGRLSINPIKHLDPLGTICMLFIGFGWAKPVPVNTRYFDKPRKGMALTAVAGPITNIILSFFGILMLAVLDIIYMNSEALTMAVINHNYLGETTFASNMYMVLGSFFYLFHILNLGLAVFNLLPIPPLDGSKILMIFLPAKWLFKYRQYEQFIQIFLLVALFTDVLTVPLSYLVGGISNGMYYIYDLLVGLAT